MSYKRLDQGRFVWPQAKDGVVSLTPATLSMLLEGMTGGAHNGRGGQRWRADAVSPRKDVTILHKGVHSRRQV